MNVGGKLSQHMESLGVGTLTVIINPEAEDNDDDLRRSKRARQIVLTPGMVDSQFEGDSFLYRAGADLSKRSLGAGSVRAQLLNPATWARAPVVEGERAPARSGPKTASARAADAAALRARSFKQFKREAVPVIKSDNPGLSEEEVAKAVRSKFRALGAEERQALADRVQTGAQGEGGPTQSRAAASEATIRFLLGAFLPRGQAIQIDGVAYTVVSFHPPLRDTGEYGGLVPERIGSRYRVTVDLELEKGLSSPAALGFGEGACRRRLREIRRDWGLAFPNRARERARTQAGRRREKIAAQEAASAKERYVNRQPGREAARRWRRVARTTGAGAGGGRGKRPTRGRRRTHSSTTRRQFRRKARTRGRGMRAKSTKRRFFS